MVEINWYGNDGRCYPLPGTVKEAVCGVCDVPMKVERNVFRTTSLVEAIAGRSHKCDAFTCSNVNEEWHKRIHDLKIDVYKAEIREAPVDYREKKAAAEKEILEILKKANPLS